MTDQEPDQVKLYLAFSQSKIPADRLTFEVDKSLDGIKKRINSSKSDFQEPRSNEVESVKPLLTSEDYYRFLNRYESSLSTFYNLVDTIKKISSDHIVSLLRDQLLPVVTSEGSLDEELDGFDIYSFDIGKYAKLASPIAEMHKAVSGFNLIPDSFLLSLVAKFDYQMSDLAKRLHLARPDRLTNSEKTLTAKEIMQMKSFEDVLISLIDLDVDKMMRGSHADMIRQFEKSFEIEVIEHYKSWPIFVEIFERRNLSAHANRCVSKEYIDKCSKEGVDLKNLKIGDHIPLTFKYITRSVDVLLEFGLNLVYVIWLKSIPDDEEIIFSHLNDACYQMIKSERLEVAERLLGFGRSARKRKPLDMVTKMMTVNLAICKKKNGKIDDTNKILSSTDWSASSKMFRICIHALKDEVDRVVEMMPSVQEDDEVGKFGFRQWPAFDSVRSDDKFTAKFEEIYREPIIAPPERALPMEVD